MTLLQDAHDALMTDQPPWFADDTLWLETFQAMFPSKRFDDAHEEIASILRLTGHRGGPVLDLGCGPGTHLIALAQRGICATGIDICGQLLERARAVVPAGLIELVQGDIRSFQRPNSYELAISMYTSFGYFAHEQQNIEVLCTTFANLKPGGQMLIDMASPELFRRLGTTPYPAEGRLVTRTAEVDELERLVKMRYEVHEQGSIKAFTFAVPLLGPVELEAMLRVAGFQSVRFYSSFDGAPFVEPTPTRMVVVAEKV